MSDHYSLVIDDSILDQLGKIIDRPISLLITDNLTIEGGRIFSGYFAFGISGDEWVNISSDWGDTPKTYLDYWCFDIDITCNPDRLVKISTNNKPLAKKVANIYLSNPIDRVTEIIIHAYGDRNVTESVHCDRSITFVGANGAFFTLVTPPTIAGWMELVTEKASQAELLKTFHERKRIRPTE